MPSPEISQPEYLRPLEPEKWNAMTKRLGHISENAAQLGIDINYVVADDGANRDRSMYKSPDEPLFGASLHKLVLALKAKGESDPHKPLSLSRFAHISGGGMYDQGDPSDAVPIGALIQDLIQYSGNRAEVALTRELGGAESLNAYLAGLDFETTRFVAAPNGGTYNGLTTPNEMLRVFDELYRGPKNELSQIVQESLQNNQVTQHGIRRHIKPDGGLRIENKTGDYPGDDDEDFPVPYSVYHDVGRVTLPEGHRLSYAIMSKARRSDGRHKLFAWHGYLANQVVSRMGAEIAGAPVGRQVFEIGGRALRYVRH